MKHLPLLLILCVLATACKKDDKEPTGSAGGSLTEQTDVLGYTILNHLPGIWNGAVTSSTALGGYPEWIMAFRPISASHVSGKAELDTLNNIFMSLFLTKHNGEYVMAFRNGGGFAGAQRVSYAKADSVNENSTEAYYRFSDFKAGEQRIYTEFRFRGDSLLMKVYTNKYNTQNTPTIHMQWNAKRVETSSTSTAIQTFNYPQKVLAKDMTDAFENLSEAIYYSHGSDPFPQSDHPHVGEATINISLGNSVQTTANGITILSITTQPLFSNNFFVPGNLKYRSRYVLLRGAGPFSYKFDLMHPGSYYLNAIYDANGDLTPASSEYLSYPFDKPFTLSPEGQTNQAADINFQIP